MKQIKDLGREEESKIEEINLEEQKLKAKNKSKDRLHIVTSDKQVHILEARQVEELGSGRRNSLAFENAIKAE